MASVGSSGSAGRQPVFFGDLPSSASAVEEEAEGGRVYTPGWRVE